LFEYLFKKGHVINHKSLIYQLKQYPRIGGKQKKAGAFKDAENVSIASTNNLSKYSEDLDKATKSNATAGISFKALNDLIKEQSSFVEKLTKSLPSVATIMTSLQAVVKEATSANQGFSRGLGIIIAQQQQYHAGILEQVKANTYLEESNKDIATSFGLNRTAAADFMHELRSQAKKLDIGDEKLGTYAGTLDGLARGFINSTTAAKPAFQEMLLGQTIMQNQLGISGEEAASFESFSSGIGKTSAENLVGIQRIADEMTKAGGDFSGVNPLQMQKDIITDISGLTADIQIQYSRYPGKLAAATQYAKKLGMSMEDLHKTGESLLNIESSIGAELEYQLLSGRKLLTNQGTSLTNEYRMATVKGDAIKQAELMSTFLEKEGHTLKNNMYARKKAAELFGTTEMALAKSIQKQELLNKLGAGGLVKLHAGNMDKVYEDLAKQGVSPDDITALKEKDDPRSTDQIANDHLSAIEANTKYKLTGDQMKVTGKTAGGIVEDTSKAALALAKAYDPLIQMFDSRAVAVTLGKVATLSGAITVANTPLTALSQNIPGVKTAVEKLTSAITAAAGFSILGGKPKVSATAVSNTTGPVLQDALIMNDGIVKFNKSDKFTKVNDSTMIAGTNVDGNKKLARAITHGPGTSIDYNRLSTAIVSAMKSAQFVATIKPDLLFKGNKYG